jgi:hypothetical protein
MPAFSGQILLPGARSKSETGWAALGRDDLIAGLSEELCESSTLTRKEL